MRCKYSGRWGLYGGTMENRTRFLSEVCAGIREHTDSLRIGVRLSVFDIPPYKADPVSGAGLPQDLEHGKGAMFGGSPENPTGFDLAEPFLFLEQLERLGIQMINLTAGCSYYNYHLSYPAAYPPIGTYQPPMDPLYQVAEHIRATAEVKKHFPNMMVVGSGYSYLQEWLPGVAHFTVRTGMTDFVGLGRCLLSYPELPADVMSGARLDRQRICRTSCDCITAPAMGLASGCSTRWTGTTCAFLTAGSCVRRRENTASLHQGLERITFI
jgi:NADPH2 dehydrogenase